MVLTWGVAMEHEEIFWVLLRVAATDLSEGRVATAEDYWVRLKDPPFSVADLRATMADYEHMLCLLRRKKRACADDRPEGIHGPQRPL